MTYEQSTGRLIATDGTLLGEGYSGAPEARNNPLMQAVQGIGPIPIGKYKLGALIQSSDHGPYAIVLIPDPLNEMLGRSGFLIHGDNIHVPGTASHGCIIQPYETRVAAWTGPDHDLEVV